MLHKRYLFTRGITFYFRWRVPVAMRLFLDRTELTLSLFTDSKRAATVRGAQLFLLVEELKAASAAFQYSEMTEEDCRHRIEEVSMRLSTRHRSAGHERTISLPQPTSAVSDSSPMLSDVYRQFVEHKRGAGLSERIQKEYDRYWLTLLQLMEDKPVASVTRKDIKNALLAYSDLPRRNIGQYRHLSVLDLLEQDIPVEHGVASKTVEQVSKLLQGVFVYAVHEHGVITESPARGLNLKLSSSRTYAPYTDLEVQALLGSCVDLKHGWQKWILLLGIYTGARRGELVKLRKQDIKIDTDTGRHYMLITDDVGSVKTENGIRQVPLHCELVDAGFLDFVRESGNDLFPDLEPHQVTGWFMRLRENRGIDSRDDYGNRKVFHSLRHSFVTKARGAGVALDMIQQVVGHERSSAGITDRYTHRFPLRDVLSVVDSIVFY